MNTFGCFRVEVRPVELKDCVEALVHTVFFHRIFDVITPQHFRSERLMLTYTKCDSPKINEEVNRLVTELKDNFSGNRQMTTQYVTIQFSVSEKKLFLFSMPKEIEAWKFEISLIPDAPDQHINSSSANQLHDTVSEHILQINEIAQRQKDHWPENPASEKLSHKISTSYFDESSKKRMFIGPPSFQ
eukprot:GCRY01005610.1.p1 GENE.GCRY01005610.1~~GCRY01005610.1.p1  ORF type:complete len:187 (+),score=18.70 GCRY01005610.1:190-750(+)